MFKKKVFRNRLIKHLSSTIRASARVANFYFKKPILGFLK